MSERAPAIALLEFDSISAGIVAGDAMVKASPLDAIFAGTVHPGKYLVMVSGDTASVEEAVTVGTGIGGDVVVDIVFLADIHPSVVAAIAGDWKRARVGDEALGIVETTTVAAVVDAADAGVKAANVGLAAIRLADGLGGKGYLLFDGDVAEVEAALDAAIERVGLHGALIRSDLIPQVHEEMAENLGRDVHFMKRVSAMGDGR